MSFKIADKNILDKYIDKTEKLIKEINESTGTIEIKGKKYYVSADGCDENDGLTPKTAWRSIEKVSNFDGFEKGDGVLFHRGDVFRFEHFVMKDGVTYTAYGDGKKPLLLASLDASGADDWEETEYPKIYRYKKELYCPDDDPVNNADVGNICFDDGRAWGIKVQETKEGNRHNIGYVHNGIEGYVTDTGRFEDERDLKHDLEYFCNWDKGALFLYSENGNPGEIFDSIEVAVRNHGVHMGKLIPTEHHGMRWSGEDITVDNLEFRGTGAHCLYTCFAKNTLIQYCVFKWIGGAIQGKYIFDRNWSTRFGDAVECCFATNHTVRYCYASQVYDCCFTVQWGAPSVMVNIEMDHNVSEFCNTGLEFWQNGGEMTNVKLHDNITRYNGYGFSNQRGHKDANFFYGAKGLAKPSDTNGVYNNVNYLSYKYTHLARPTGAKYYNFHDNVYIMEKGKYLGGIVEHPATSEGEWVNVEYTKENIERLQGEGFEPNTEFFLMEDTPFDDMYKLSIK